MFVGNSAAAQPKTVAVSSPVAIHINDERQEKYQRQIALFLRGTGTKSLSMTVTIS
jgi:hypothetical protein